MDQEILVPFYIEFLFSHGRKPNQPPPPDPPTALGKKVMKSYCHIVVVTCPLLGRAFLSSSLKLAVNLNYLIR